MGAGGGPALSSYRYSPYHLPSLSSSPYPPAGLTPSLQYSAAASPVSQTTAAITSPVVNPSVHAAGGRAGAAAGGAAGALDHASPTNDQVAAALQQQQQQLQQLGYPAAGYQAVGLPAIDWAGMYGLPAAAAAGGLPAGMYTL